MGPRVWSLLDHNLLHVYVPIVLGPVPTIGRVAKYALPYRQADKWKKSPPIG